MLVTKKIFFNLLQLLILLVFQPILTIAAKIFFKIYLVVSKK
jgi:hypothetical protein